MTARTDTPLQACLAEALGLARGWIARWLDQTQAALAQRETNARHGHEKHSLGQARSALMAHRVLLGQRFLDALCDGLEQCEPPAPTGAPASRQLHSLSFDELELMDDDQMQQSVNLTRVQQIIKLEAADELAAFSARLSRVQGFDVLRADANPLRPEAVMTALVAALDSLHVADGIRSHWLAAGAAPLGQQLSRFYQQLEEWLDHQGVAPAGYVVIQSPTPRQTQRARPAGPTASAMPVETLMDLHALLPLDRLHDLLAGNLAQAGAAVSDQGRSGSGNAMVRTLAGELVNRLLRQATGEPHLLPSVRDLMLQLKEPLHQLARTDPRFFADRQNPARRLLESIATRGLAFATEQDAGFETFAGSLVAVVRSLQAPAHRLPSLLSAAIGQLPPAAQPAALMPTGSAQPRVAPQSACDVLAEQVAAEFQARDDFARAPGVVRRFVTGPWAQVVAQARLSLEASGRPLESDAPVLRYIDVLTDLLWSSQLVLASRNRPRLIKAVPNVLRTLREGLDTIDYPRPKAEAFFHTLLGLQDAAYLTQHSVDLVHEPVWADAGSSTQAGGVGHSIRVRPNAAHDRSQFVDGGFHTPPDFVDTEPVTSDWLALNGREAPPVADGLSVGAWVDLHESGRTLRCQLNWASPHGRLFQFVAPQGRSISLSRTGLQRLHTAGRLRLVASVPDAMAMRH